MRRLVPFEKRKKRTYIIIDTNCDCCSDRIARLPTRYVWGPRCPSCRKILGMMEWRSIAKVRARSEWEALAIYRQALKAKNA